MEFYHLLVNIANPLVPSIAANRSNAFQWIYAVVVPFFPCAKISTISVGNDLLETSPEDSSFLLPAMENVHLALCDLGIRTIFVSTTFSFINVFAKNSFSSSTWSLRQPVQGASHCTQVRSLPESMSRSNNLGGLPILSETE